MTPDDPRHGTTRGHAAGCRELCCRRARNADEARRRKYRQVLGITRSVDATGTRRRIHALMALGWPSREIAARCGWTTGEAVLEVSRRNWVQTKTAETIARVYDHLSMTLGPSDATRRRAIAKGWAPPLAWDCIDTDPHPKGLATADSRAWDDYDETVVERILAGEWRTRARLPERLAVVAVWAADGLSTNEIERRTGWNVRRDQRRSEGTAA